MKKCITVSELISELKRYPLDMPVLRYNLEMDGYENVSYPESGDWSDQVTPVTDGSPYIDWVKWKSDGDDGTIAFII